MRRRSFLSAAGVGAVGLTAAACGSSKSSTATTAKTATTSTLTGVGPFTFVSGKDTTGYYPKAIAAWNAANPKEKCTFIQLSTSADQQLQSMVQNALAKTATYGVLSTDVVWTAEFAANGYIEQLDPSDFALSTKLPPTVTTAQYFGKLYAVPFASDGGLLYSRSDLLEKAGMSKAPSTYAEIIAAYDKVKGSTPGLQGYSGQFQKYEGLTCNVSEVINSSGGEILNAADKPDVDTAAATTGLTFLTNGFKEGYIPKAALTYEETESLQAFVSGQLMFLRNWSYAYAIANATDGSSKVNGKIIASPLPGLKTTGTSTLGGHNLAVSTFCKNKQSAINFAKFMTSADQQRTFLTTTTNAPAIAELYTDAALVKQFPFLPILLKSITTAKKRPEAVNYNDVTTAIQNATYASLEGQLSPSAALKQMQTTLTAALAKQ
jgi:multiple sugar transport system substrate-binding protein